MDLDINPVNVVKLGNRSNKPRPLKIVLPKISNVFLMLKNKNHLYILHFLQFQFHFHALHKDIHERKSSYEQDFLFSL